MFNLNRSLGDTWSSSSIYGILIFLSASWPHLCLDVARYDSDSDAANLLETNTNLPQILTTDLGLMAGLKPDRCCMRGVYRQGGVGGEQAMRRMAGGLGQGKLRVGLVVVAEGTYDAIFVISVGGWCRGTGAAERDSHGHFGLLPVAVLVVAAIGKVFVFAHLVGTGLTLNMLPICVPDF